MLDSWSHFLQVQKLKENRIKMLLWPWEHFVCVCWRMAPETCTLQGCFFHWWKSFCCHQAKVSLPKCLLIIPALQVLLPPLLTVSNSVNHICFCVSIIKTISLVSTNFASRCHSVLDGCPRQTEHFWSLRLFNSVVILQFKWQAMRVQSPIISSLYAVVHAFNVWKALGSRMWNEQNNS